MNIFQDCGRGGEGGGRSLVGVVPTVEVELLDQDDGGRGGGGVHWQKMFNLQDKVYLNLKMKPDDIRHLIHGEFNANQKSSARTNTKKTTIWSIG